MKRISWGVLSTAKIGTQRVIPAIQAGLRSTVTAIASRDIARARATASALNIPRAYGSYEELLADPTIDAIYNPLPNHLHVPWTIKALEAGKHVLCEKPIGLNAREAEALLGHASAAASRCWRLSSVRYHPQWLRARALVQAGRIGEARVVQVSVTSSILIRRMSATGPISAVAHSTTSAVMLLPRRASCSRRSRCVRCR